MADASHNETPSPLRVGLLVTGEVERWAAALRDAPGLELTCAAGMPQADAPRGAAWFDDTRTLLAQGPADAVLVAAAPRLAAELTAQAISHGKHVWRTAPLGRTFAEAIELVRAAREAGVVLRVASWWDHVAEPVRALVRQRDALRPLLTELNISAPWPAAGDWRLDQVEAGGGVLLCEAYAMLEMLVSLRGLPDSVSAAVARCRRGDGRVRETEDVGLAILRFDGGGLAELRATWGVGPYQLRSAHHGATDTVIVEPGAALRTFHDRDEQRRVDLPGDLDAAELRALHAAVREPLGHEAAQVALERHVAVTALIETLYLAARTMQPEQPARLYEVQRWPLRRR